MEASKPLIIEKTANGYIVREHTKQDFVEVSDFFVFNDMGYASSARDNQPTKATLLGFIESHFGDQA